MTADLSLYPQTQEGRALMRRWLAEAKCGDIVSVRQIDFDGFAAREPVLSEAKRAGER